MSGINTQQTIITVVTSIGTSIVTTLIAQAVQALRDGMKAKKAIKKDALTLYTDMNQSIESIDTIINLNKAGNTNQVLKNSHSLLGNNFFSTLVKIRSKLSKEEFNAINKFYNNVIFLESTRKEYWKLTNPQAIAQKNKEYIGLLQLINRSNKMLNIKSIISKLENISN